MLTDIIATQGLTKTYQDRAVVDSLDLRVPEGAVYGFLGPNGSGKSTTMKMLLGLTQPDGGQITIFGRPLTRASRLQLLPQIGSMIEEPPGYGHLTGRENLRIVQDMLDLTDAQVDWALATVRLTESQDKLVRDYSLGMKQRLGIALALARSPRLLILDEPTNGLDPAGMEEVRDLIMSLAQQGITVMVSSHLLDEIDKMATVLGILSAGRLIFQGTREQLFHHALPDLLIETPDPETALAVLGRDYAPDCQGHQLRFGGLDRDQGSRIVHRLTTGGVAVYQVRRVQQSLEEVFMELTGRGGPQ